MWRRWCAACCTRRCTARQTGRWPSCRYRPHRLAQPLSCAQAYFFDAFNERIWVDLDECKGFTRDVLSVLGASTGSPAAAAPAAQQSPQAPDTLSPQAIVTDIGFGVCVHGCTSLSARSGRLGRRLGRVCDGGRDVAHGHGTCRAAQARTRSWSCC